MKFRGRLKDCSMSFSDNKWMFTAEVNEDFRKPFEALKDQELTIDLSKYSPIKSDDQRKYFWEIIRIIRMKLKNGTNDDDIYLKILRDSGIREYVALRDEDVHLAYYKYRIVDDVAEDVLTTEKGKKIKFHTLRCWKGLSQYTQEEASVLIDGAIEEALAADIPLADIVPPDQREEYRQLYGSDI